MKSYDQYCSVARALDAVGDRWTLLIVRELMLQGPCRFTDLRNGLPGIAPNLLSNRLKDLEAEGLVTREDAPPPIATALYGLTESGQDLEPVLKALGVWGLRFMEDERPDDTFQARWLAHAATSLAADGGGAAPGARSDAGADASPAVVQLVASGECAVIELGNGPVRARVGRVADPDLVLEGPPRSVLGLLTGKIDLGTATRIGLTATGRLELLDRLRPAARRD